MICINNAPICDFASDNCLTNNKINSAPFEIHNVQSKSNYIHLNQSNQIIFYQVKFKERSQSNSKCNTTWKYAQKKAQHIFVFFVIFFLLCWFVYQHWQISLNSINAKHLLMQQMKQRQKIHIFRISIKFKVK